MEDPAFVLDYCDTLSCARLAALIRDKSGQDKTLDVDVRPEYDPTAKALLSQATSNHVSKTLSVVVITEDDLQIFNVDFEDVLYGMSQVHPEKQW